MGMNYKPWHKLNIRNSIYTKYMNEEKGIIFPQSKIPFINIEEMKERENHHLADTTVIIVASKND